MRDRRIKCVTVVIKRRVERTRGYELTSIVNASRTRFSVIADTQRINAFACKVFIIATRPLRYSRVLLIRENIAFMFHRSFVCVCKVDKYIIHNYSNVLPVFSERWNNLTEINIKSDYYGKLIVYQYQCVTARMTHV